MASGIVEPSQSGPEQSGQQQGQKQGQQIARARLVQRLLAASASLPNFVNDLIFTQAHVVAGTEAAAFLIEPAEEGKFNLKALAHIRPDDSDADTRAAAIAAFQDIVKPCVQQNKDGAIQIEGTGDGSDTQFCLVTLLRSDGNPVAVSAVITRCRDLQRATQRLELMNLVGGYFELFTLRRTSEQSRSVAQSHQHVLQLATAVATAEGFASAAINLCNELASRTGASRVSLGWLKGNKIKLQALSHSEQFDKKQELSVTLVKVMEECLDQEEIVQYEPDGSGTNNVTREAQALSRTQGGETVLSLPLRRRGEIVGVIMLEFAPGTKLGAQAATGLAVAVELLAPQLYDRYQNDRYIITKAGLSIRELAKKTYGPKYMLAKTIVALLIVVFLFLVLYRPMYYVKAPFRFTPIERRVISAPFEGVLLEVGRTRDGRLLAPGDRVAQGQVLLQFDDTELRLKRLESVSQANQAAREAAKYRAEKKTAEALMAQQEELAQKAAAAYYEELINRARITAPFDGEVLVGDLKDKRGAVFKQGDQLMEVAQRDSLKAELIVHERDIQDVIEGAKGYLATNALPNETFPIAIERIVPLGEAKDASNVFRVYATLDSTNEQWRPGMQGEARIEVGRRALVWIWTHRFVDFVRMKLWL